MDSNRRLAAGRPACSSASSLTTCHGTLTSANAQSSRIAANCRSMGSRRTPPRVKWTRSRAVAKVPVPCKATHAMNSSGGLTRVRQSNPRCRTTAASSGPAVAARTPASTWAGAAQRKLARCSTYRWLSRSAKPSISLVDISVRWTGTAPVPVVATPPHLPGRPPSLRPVTQPLLEYEAATCHAKPRGAWSCRADADKGQWRHEYGCAVMPGYPVRFRRELRSGPEPWHALAARPQPHRGLAGERRCPPAGSGRATAGRAGG